MNCFPAMTGKEMEARIHGTVESILFALYYQNAQLVSASDKIGEEWERIYRVVFRSVGVSEDVPCHLHCAC